ncbi:kielin/chordin-like protein [Saccoglossus kowalevskii]|uniref:Kielin/chordin-like protein-like n=1 Tax=Saccoglossus kowalevskii TaxID=10224 RepID=A0ABM0GSZ0_SACKO|nr:PREDICTED: kielin/chordin-like protein-like [Saccoglossus kowalevskii]
MWKVLLISLFFISSVATAPSEDGRIRTRRDPQYDVVVSSQRQADCSLALTFIRSDSTNMPKLTVRFDIDQTPAANTHEGEIVLQPGLESETLDWNVPIGWNPPFVVSGVSMLDDPNNVGDFIQVGQIVQHTIPDDGPCVMASAKRDPHMATFDGFRYNFQGTCWYTLVKHCTENPEFEISARFEPLKSNGPEIKSRATAINVTIGDERISLDKDTILVNDQPYWVAQLSDRPRNAHIDVNSDSIVIDIARLKLEVEWDGRKHIFNAAILNPEYHGKVCGLLGNADENPHNDLQKRDGSTTLDIDEFGASWRTPGIRCDY